jgi:hypothetical protein
VRYQFNSHASRIVLAVSFVTVSAWTGRAQAPPLESGQAAGTLTANGKTHKLAHASAYIDAKDESRPTVLLLTDVPPNPALFEGRVTITFAQVTAEQPFSGLVFKMNERGIVRNVEYYDKDEATNVTGLFDLKLDAPLGKTIVGSVKHVPDAASKTPPVQLEATFHATVK